MTKTTALFIAPLFFFMTLLFTSCELSGDEEILDDLASQVEIATDTNEESEKKEKP